MEPTVLIVEDSGFYGKLLVRVIEKELGYRTAWFLTLEEAAAYLENNAPPSIALLDFHLPDATNGEVVDLCVTHKIPSIVISADYSDDVQEFIWTKPVIDYVIKEGTHAVTFIVDLIARVVKNHNTGILVVDDSKVARRHVAQLLSIHQYKIYEAADGNEALQVLNDHDDIKLVVTDYMMPGMDGFELTQKIRRTYPLGRLAIVGLSARGNHRMSVKFIKYGANDFLAKPFISEQLYCRVTQNIQIVEQFDLLREVSLIDHLTNLSNRRYLFEAGDILFENAQRHGHFPVVAMLDIDNFKTVNDRYGHDVGDTVLTTIAGVLKHSVRKSDILSRYGGEEFCVIANSIRSDAVEPFFDAMRVAVGEIEHHASGGTFHTTVSIGVCAQPQSSFAAMIKVADEQLYDAKRRGKNTVVVA